MALFLWVLDIFFTLYEVSSIFFSGLHMVLGCEASSGVHPI